MQKDLSFKSLSSSTGADDGVTSAHNVAVKVNLTLRLSSTQKDQKGKKNLLPWRVRVEARWRRRWDFAPSPTPLLVQMLPIRTPGGG